MKDEVTLLEKVQHEIERFGCTAIELTADAVASMGDGRATGPGVIVQFPKGVTNEEISLISNTVTNRVRGITRVLMLIEPEDTT